LNSISPFIKRLLLCTPLLLATFIPTFAQCTKKIAELPAAPELLGLHLGMTRDEIKTWVPQTVFGKTDDFGVAKTTINPYFDPKINQSKFANVRSISLDLLDDKLTSIWIGFDNTFKAQTTDDFIKLVSESLKVPSAWQSGRARSQQLRCSDFQLIVSTVAGGPSFRLLDVAAEDTVATRRQTKEEADAARESGDETETEILGDKQSKTYFSAGCKSVAEVSAQNRVSFKSVGEAEKAGFKLAKNCH
jgi:hypothetical protein